jgi:hypothetical protein
VRTGTSTVGHIEDVVFYASVIVVVILVRLSRDADRQCCFFFAIRIACSKHKWCSTHSCTHTHARSSSSSFFLLHFSFQFEQFCYVVGKRAQWMEEGKDRKRERENVRSDGRLNVGKRARERKPTRYLFFFDILLLLPWCTYVNEMQWTCRMRTHFCLFGVNKEGREKKNLVFCLEYIDVYFRSNNNKCIGPIRMKNNAKKVKSTTSVIDTIPRQQSFVNNNCQSSTTDSGMYEFSIFLFIDMYVN